MSDFEKDQIGAVVLAAGLSTRMGRPKMVLPWNGSTVIGKVVSTLLLAGVNEVVVVTGGSHNLVEHALAQKPIKCVFNPEYSNGEMLTSLKIGLSHMPINVEAALIVLGDQPAIEEQVVRNVIGKYRSEKAQLIVPSYKMRRGHPWLVSRELWPQILEIFPPETLRDFIQVNAAHIHYLNVDTPSILQDLDTPEDYQSQQPESGK
jgi:molybdenum cofactor cytidylyltransferase